MEINRDQFEKITSQAQQEAKAKKAKQQDIKQKWDALHRKYKVEEVPSKFPLVQYQPPEGFEK